MQCPCCGSEIPDIEASSIIEMAKLSPQQRVIVKTLIAAYPRGARVDNILHEMYAGVAGGTPLSAEKCLYVQVFKMKDALRAVGWRTISYKNFYKLVRI